MTNRRRWLHLGEGLRLPLDVISRRTAILGQTDTGKTSTAVVMVEEAASCGAAFAIIDPTDAWWGIASSGEGNGPGVDCVVIGGPHGDVPIDEHAGRVVARLVADEGYSVVLCLKSLGSWSARQRFVADFLSELYEHAARQVLLVVDEAHRFAPQRAQDEGGHAARCMGAMIDVVLLGRRQGLGTVVVTQRTARLHKDVLEATEVLIAHRLRGTNDRKALAGWVEDADADLKTIMAEVGRAPKGVAHVSAPTLDVGGTYTIRPKRTFDSSKTIELGDVAVEPKARATVDMAALERHLAETIERQKAEDPAALRDELAKVRQQLADALEQQGPTDADLAESYRAGWEASRADVAADVQRVRDDVGHAVEAAARLAVSAEHLGEYFKLTDGAPRSAPEGVEGVQTRAAPQRPRAQAPADRGNGRTAHDDGRGRSPGRESDPSLPAIAAGNGAGIGLKVGEERMLRRLAERHPLRHSQAQALRVGGYKSPSGGGAQATWRTLTGLGYLEDDGDGYGLTHAGLAASGIAAPEPPRTAAEALDRWRAILNPSERKVFDALVNITGGTRPTTQGRLAEVAGYAASGGGFQGALRSLVRSGLAERRGKDHVRLTPRATETA